MRRMITIGLAAALAAIALPAAASAHHSTRAHSERVHHHRRHLRAHTVVFSPASTTTTPTTTTETPSGEDALAGTIASFEGGVLKITLSDGTMVSGKVTEGTEIQCGSPGHDGEQGDDGEDRGDDHGPLPGGFSGGHGDQGDDERGSTAPAGTPAACGTASLVPGAKVHEAELSVSGSGAAWQKVELASS